MKLLFDTHVFLWFIMGDSRLSAAARQWIEDLANDRLLSVVSLWEMAVKVNVGKLHLAEPFHVLIPREISNNAFRLLPVSLAHTIALSTLPLHHRDPFDRLL